MKHNEHEAMLSIENKKALFHSETDCYITCNLKNDVQDLEITER